MPGGKRWYMSKIMAVLDQGLRQVAGNVGHTCSGIRKDIENPQDFHTGSAPTR